MMKVPKEPGLSPNNGLENVFLSGQSMASKMCTLCQLAMLAGANKDTRQTQVV